jgi:hypothetical protein
MGAGGSVRPVRLLIGLVLVGICARVILVGVVDVGDGR